LAQENVEVGAAHDAVVLHKGRDDAGGTALQENRAMDVGILLDDRKIRLFALLKRKLIGRMQSKDDDYLTSHMYSALP
jgi:hypothetical protein